VRRDEPVVELPGRRVGRGRRYRELERRDRGNEDEEASHRAADVNAVSAGCLWPPFQAGLFGWMVLWAKALWTPPLPIDSSAHWWMMQVG
jgi:hypothetical protein